MNPVLFKALFIIQKNLFWVLLLGFLLMLFAYMGNVIANQNTQLEYSKAVYHETQNELAGVKTILSQKTNELGQQQTTVQALVGDKQSLQHMLNNQNSFFSKQLEELKIDLKDLKSVTNLKVTTSGQFVTVTRDTIVERIVERYVGDSLKQDTLTERLTLINYKEPAGWFTMTGSISGDTMKFQPTFYEQYDIAIHDERKPKRYLLDFFPGKHIVGTVVSKNPYIHTNNVKVIVQNKKRKGILNLF